MKNKFYVSIFSAFLLSSLAIIALKNYTVFHQNVLLIGNLFLLAVSLVSYSLVSKNANNQNPRKFINGVMASTLFRLMLCIFAILGLLLYFKKTLPKENIFILMALYALYMVIDTAFTVNQANKK